MLGRIRTLYRMPEELLLIEPKTYQSYKRTFGRHIPKGLAVRQLEKL